MNPHGAQATSIWLIGVLHTAVTGFGGATGRAGGRAVGREGVGAKSLWAKSRTRAAGFGAIQRNENRHPPFESCFADGSAMLSLSATVEEKFLVQGVVHVGAYLRRPESHGCLRRTSLRVWDACPEECNTVAAEDENEKVL